MRSPQRTNNSLRRVSQSASTPAPVGGWNQRDSLADMPEDDAVILDNYFPTTDSVTLRKGHTSHATHTGTGQSLMAHTPATGTAKMFVAANSAVYECTSSGAVGAAEFSGLTNVRFQHTMFGNSAGNFLVMCNGEDAVRNFDGSSWTTPTITGSGLTSSNLIHVNAFKRRLFFIEKAKLSFWYFTSTEAISGAVAEFRLGGLCQLGGYVMAMGTWTRDGGDGIDDLAVFVTSKGEAIIFQGTDPGTASTWALVGVFRIGAPIGRRCMVKVGGELYIITVDGYFPISRAIASSRVSESLAISEKISGAVRASSAAHRTNFGWQPILYPYGNYALFNVPTYELQTSQQHVVNTTTGAWCRFTGQNAFAWEVFNDKLYFAGDGAVYQADNGFDDAGSDIDGEAKTAFAYLGGKGTEKRFLMARPIVTSEGTPVFAMKANVDFETDAPTSTPTYTGSSGSAWDTSPWDTSAWGGAPTIRKAWQGVDGVGHCVALHIKSKTQDIGLQWFSTDWVYERGGSL